ncbi:1582_t:CDS:2, partial [Acaulospora colombiana]
VEFSLHDVSEQFKPEDFLRRLQVEFYTVSAAIRACSLTKSSPTMTGLIHNSKESSARSTEEVQKEEKSKEAPDIWKRASRVESCEILSEKWGRMVDSVLCQSRRDDDHAILTGSAITASWPSSVRGRREREQTSTFRYATGTRSNRNVCEFERLNPRPLAADMRATPTTWLFEGANSLWILEFSGITHTIIGVCVIARGRTRSSLPCISDPPFRRAHSLFFLSKSLLGKERCRILSLSLDDRYPHIPLLDTCQHSQQYIPTSARAKRSLVKSKSPLPSPFTSLPLPLPYGTKRHLLPLASPSKYSHGAPLSSDNSTSSPSKVVEFSLHDVSE